MADDRLVAIVLIAIAGSVICDVEVNGVSTIDTGSENSHKVSGVPLHENKPVKQNSESSYDQQTMKNENSAQPNTQPNLVQSISQDQNLVPKIIKEEINPEQPIPIGQNIVQSVPPVKKPGLPISQEQNDVKLFKQLQQKTSQQNTQQQISSGQNPAQPISSGQNPAQPISSGQIPAQPISSGQNPAQPVSLGQNPAQPISLGQNPAQPISSGRNAAQPISSGQNPTQPNLSGQNPAQPNSLGQNPAQAISSGQNPAQPISSGQNIAQPNLSGQNLVQPISQGQNPVKLTSQGKNPAQLIPQEMIPVQPNPDVQNSLQPVPQKQNPIQDISQIQNSVQPNKADLAGKNTKVTSSLQQEIATVDGSDQSQNFDFNSKMISSYVTGVPQTETSQGILNGPKNTMSKGKNTNQPTIYNRLPQAQKHTDLDFDDVTQTMEVQERMETSTEYFTTSKQFRNDMDNVPVGNIKLTTARKSFLPLQPGPVILNTAQINNVPDPSKRLFVSDTTLALSSYTTTAWSSEDEDKDTLKAKDNFYEGLDLWDEEDEDEFPTDDTQPLSTDKDNDWNFFMGEKLIPKGKAVDDTYRPLMESFGDEKGYPPPKEGLVTSGLHNKNEDINIKMDMIAYYSWILFITLLIFAIFIFARQRQKFGYVLKWGQSKKSYGHPSDAEEGKNLMKNIYT